MPSTRPIKGILSVLVIAALLSGCATAAQRQYQAIAANNGAAVAQLASCTSAVYNSPENAPIRRHFPARISELSLEQLADASTASDEEIRIILAVHPQLQECRRSALDRLVKSSPSFVPILIVEFNKNEDDLLSLIQRKIAWVEYTKRVRDRAAETRVALQAESQRIVAGLNQEHHAELARRQAALDALAQWAQTQQVINAMNRPVVTNCNQFGGMVNCVTH
jgi:hypothetical protein